jgi:hypothetical protein
MALIVIPPLGQTKETPLHVALRRHDDVAAKMLMSAKADLEARNQVP